MRRSFAVKWTILEKSVNDEVTGLFTYDADLDISFPKPQVNEPVPKRRMTQKVRGRKTVIANSVAITGTQPDTQHHPPSQVGPVLRFIFSPSDKPLFAVYAYPLINTTHL